MIARNVVSWPTVRWLLLGLAVLLSVAAPAAHADQAAIEALIDRQVPLYVQGEDGALQDPFDSTREPGYGTPAWGYVAMRSALRTGDRALLDRAFRALHRPVRTQSQSPFDHWILARTLQDGTSRLAGDPAWEDLAAAIRTYVHGSHSYGASACMQSDACFNNWKLIELNARSILAAGHDERMASLAQQVRTAAAIPARGSLIVGRAARAISDPPGYPLAYSVFSAVHLQSALAQQPAWATPQDYALRDDLTQYLITMQAPDGTLAYQARSQHQTWTLAGAMRVGVHMQTAAGAAMAASAWAALQRVTPRADGLLPIAPVLQVDGTYAGVDTYSGQAVYGPLTLMLLQEAADGLHGRALTAAAAAHRPVGVMDDVPASGVRIRQTAQTWVAWQQRVSDARDARYARGPQSMQVHTATGWVSLLPARPRLAAGGDALPHSRGRALTLGAGRGDAGRDAAIEVRAKTKPNARVTWRLHLPATTRVTRRSVTFDRTRIDTPGQPIRVTAKGRTHASATHPALRLHVIHLQADKRGVALVRFRAR